MNDLRYTIILLLLFVSIWCRRPKTGIPCHEGNVTGTCRGIFECSYAERTINELEKKVLLCGYDSDGIQIPCCPSQNLFHRFGVFRDYFKASNDGVISATNLTCRYEGRQPLLCCKNQPQIPDPPEPEGCPPLVKPKLKTTPVEQLLWDKCINYQRYVNKCVHDEKDLENYIRQDTCGIPNTNSRFRIHGGEPAEPRQFPHMAAVGCHIEKGKDDADIAWVGGGSLISEKFILTAAHVLWSPDYGRIRYALLGTLDKKDNTGLLLNVINTLPHKLYNRRLDNKMYDIALLTLHERVKFNEFVRPICLPVSDRKINENLIIAGWGEINNKADSSQKLLTANIMENNESCSNHMKERYDPKTMICAHGTINKKEDSCKGDSGGPLMAIMTNLHCSYSIEGIVSFGQGRCGDNPLGVYTRVTAYLDWIVENVWPDDWQKLNKKT